MVTQNMLKTYQGKWIFKRKKKSDLWLLSTETKQITEITSYVRNYFLITIWYEYHELNIGFGISQNFEQ